MVWLLVAWVFWLALNGRLGAYASFATTAGAGGNVFQNFSIPVSVKGLLGSIGSPSAANNQPPSQSGQPASPSTPAFMGGLSPTAIPGVSQSSSGTAYVPSAGNPDVLTTDTNDPTFQALFQAQQNVLLGGPL